MGSDKKLVALARECADRFDDENNGPHLEEWEVDDLKNRILATLKQAVDKDKEVVYEEYEAMKARVTELEKLYLHHFEAQDIGIEFPGDRFCGKCGLYLTDPVHVQTPPIGEAG